MFFYLRKIPYFSISICFLSLVTIFNCVPYWSFGNASMLGLLWGFLLLNIYFKFRQVRTFSPLIIIGFFLMVYSGIIDRELIHMKNQPAIPGMFLGFVVGQIFVIPLYWPTSGHKLMCFAAADGLLPVVRLLNKLGISVAGLGNGAGSPLYAAVRCGRHQTVDYILNQYVPFNLSVYESTAVINNDPQMVNLIRKHARPAQK